MTKKTNAPNIMVKSYNYLKAISKHVLNGLENVNETTFYDRSYICSRCPKLILDEVTSTPECSVCGCPIPKKASWKSEKCPLNKW